VKCELLCFIQDKSTLMAADHLVKVCADFYRKEEIDQARNLLQKHITERLPHRKGGDNARTVQDLLKVCTDPNITLPRFYAQSLARLPPVDVSHCDVSAILKELQALRSEVRQSTDLQSQMRSELRELKDLREEINALKSTVNQLTSASPLPLTNLIAEVDSVKDVVSVLQASSINIRDEVHSLKAAVNQLQMTSTNALSVVTSAQSLSNNHSAESAAPAAASFASLAKNLQSAPGIQLASTSKKPARRATAVCGKATGKSLLVVDGIRRVDIFVTRLRPDTTTESVSNLIKDSFPLCTSVAVEKLETRFDTYASFRAELCVKRSQFDTLIESVYAEDSWPSGVLVRRYFRNNNGSRN
jgi:prefoldin subunit 5